MRWVVEMDDTVYKPPPEIDQGDETALGYLEMDKLLELREAFNVIDLNGDGLIDFEDLKGLFLSMGSSTDEETIAGMIEEVYCCFKQICFIHKTFFSPNRVMAHSTLSNSPE